MERFPDPATIAQRPPYRPPIGIPLRDEPRAKATVASLLLHTLVVLLVVAPTLFISSQLANVSQGAGGKGPVGGGGGGTPGGGSVRFTPEKLRYLRLSTPPEQQKQEQIKPPIPTPKPPPVEKKKPEPAEPSADTKAVASADSGRGNSVGSGEGAAGTRGSGPGSGGGVGSGEGPGRGSGNGPGTGGGNDTVYPPAVVALPILPLPVPSKVRPYKMVAQFEVDSAGNARLLSFNPSRDAGYNRRIREMLLEIRFRPAVTFDGRPVKAIAVITAEAM